MMAVRTDEGQGFGRAPRTVARWFVAVPCLLAAASFLVGASPDASSGDPPTADAGTEPPTVVTAGQATSPSLSGPKRVVLADGGTVRVWHASPGAASTSHRPNRALPGPPPTTSSTSVTSRAAGPPSSVCIGLDPTSHSGCPSAYPNPYLCPAAAAPTGCIRPAIGLRACCE